MKVTITMIMTMAHIIADTAIISEIRVSGLDHSFLFSFRMELKRDPTRLMATKNTKFDM